ncbi:hypothetical protein SLA2020_351440 [Shorea laevis]
MSHRSRNLTVYLRLSSNVFNFMKNFCLLSQRQPTLISPLQSLIPHLNFSFDKLPLSSQHISLPRVSSTSSSPLMSPIYSPPHHVTSTTSNPSTFAPSNNLPQDQSNPGSTFSPILSISLSPSILNSRMILPVTNWEHLVKIVTQLYNTLQTEAHSMLHTGLHMATPTQGSYNVSLHALLTLYWGQEPVMQEGQNGEFLMHILY